MFNRFYWAPTVQQVLLGRRYLTGSTGLQMLNRFYWAASVLQVLLGCRCSTGSTRLQVFNRFYCSLLTQNPPFTSQPLRFLSSHRSLNPALVIWRLCVTLVELKGQRKPRRRAATASSLISSERLKKTQRKTEK